MEIPLVDLSSNYRRIQAEIDTRIEDVIDETQFIGGDPVETFEHSFAQFVDTDHAVALNSGTDAIRLGLEALGIGEGDEVITVSHTWVSTVDGIVHNDARPRFVDIDEGTYNMNPNLVAEAITEETAAILPVHLYGQAVEVDPLIELADEHDVLLIEDACQAHGATANGQPCGSIGDIGCFSFYPSKNLGAFGDAGMVVTDDESTASRLKRLREYGAEQKHNNIEFGYNSRMDTLQAAVLNAKLPHLSDWNEDRRSAAQRYSDALENTPLVLPETADYNEHVFYVYVVQAESQDQRDALRAHLEEDGIGTGIHYPVPVHKQPSYQSLDADFSTLAVTEGAATRILSIPMYPELGAEEIEYIADSVRTFYNLD